MKLRYLATNTQWVFLFGPSIVRLHGEATFFPTRREAVKAAHDRGLVVDKDGNVSVNPVHTHERRDV
jgi:hypothetical protein